MCLSPAKLSKSEEKVKRNCPLTEIETNKVLTKKLDNQTWTFTYHLKQRQQKFTTINLLISHCYNFFCLIQLFVAHVKVKGVN